jgi:hypothetical protein
VRYVLSLVFNFEAVMRIMLRRLAVVGALAGVFLAVAVPASARVFVGFGFGGFGVPYYYPPPVYYPPPAYYPPPGYYPPPPAYYAPPQGNYAPPANYAPQSAPGASGENCYVNGTALCPMERPSPIGSTCWCSTDSGRVYGQAR